MPLAIFEWRALQFVSLVAVMVWKFSCLSSASLCNSTPHCFKDDKSQQEIKMKQWWFLVVFCSNLEAFHLQGSISQYGERLWLELVLLNGTTGNLTFTNDFGRGKQEWEIFTMPCKRQTCKLLLHSYRPFLKCRYSMRFVPEQIAETHLTIYWNLQTATSIISKCVLLLN